MQIYMQMMVTFQFKIQSSWSAPLPPLPARISKPPLTSMHDSKAA